jgi:hypothetical protein
MNFDDALKRYLPRAWFRFKSIKYKYFNRGEREIWLVRHLVEPGSTALDIDVEGHEEAVLDGASALVAAQRPVLMIELVEAFNPGVVARLATRYGAQSYCVFFLKDGLKPIAQFDAARDQQESLLPTGEYVGNFFFIPEEKAERILARLA